MNSSLKTDAFKCCRLVLVCFLVCLVTFISFDISPVLLVYLVHLHLQTNLNGYICNNGVFMKNGLAQPHTHLKHTHIHTLTKISCKLQQWYFHITIHPFYLSVRSKTFHTHFIVTRARQVLLMTAHTLLEKKCAKIVPLRVQQLVTGTVPSKRHLCSFFKGAY